MLGYDTILKYRVNATLTQPLHVGGTGDDRNEILVDPVSGIPFVQASSIAGALRRYYEKEFGKFEAGILFGEANAKSEDGSSRIRFSDAFVNVDDTEKVRLEYRPRVKISEKYGSVASSKVKGADVESGHKFEMLYVGAGTNLSFDCYCFLESREANVIEERMKDLFSAMEFGEIRIGGQQSNGCGYLSIFRLDFVRFNLCDANDLEFWLKESELQDEEYQDIHSELKETESDDYIFTLIGKTEGDLLVRGTNLTEFGEGAPDAVNIQNAKKEFIIPGSSFKGVMRSQMKRIAAYLNPVTVERVIEDTFGTTLGAGEGGNTGNSYFRDTIVGDWASVDNIPLRHRIHVDKFTGGVIHGGKFSEKNIAGDVRFVVRIKNRNNQDRSAGLLLMALRDLAIGMVSVGSGSSVGKGFIDVERIEIKKQGKLAVVYPKEDRIEDDNQLIASCLQAVKGG